MDVDIAELIIELDTVKGHRLIILDEDIAQMQIAVAASPKPQRLAGIQEGRLFSKGAVRGRHQNLHRLRAQDWGQMAQMLGIGGDGVAQCRRPAALRFGVGALM